MAEDIPTAAHAYAAAGLAVVPLHTPDPEMATSYPCSCGTWQCPHPGKHPRTRHGKDEASTDPERIRQWWRHWPRANIGVVPPPGVVVLDVDPRHGGDAVLEFLEAWDGPLPRTLRARTGSGGEHIWLWLNGPVRGVLQPGIDVKTATGLLVAPPSWHVTGGRYTWTLRLPIAPAPAWVVRDLTPRRPRRSRSTRGLSERAAEGLVRTVAEASRGERNRKLHWAACRAWERGGDRAVLGRLRAAARSAGLADGEIEATVISAARAARTGAAA